MTVALQNGLRELAPSDPFSAWISRANTLLDFLENAPGMARMLGAPPVSDDPAARADALARLWERCQFQPLEPDGPRPWEAREAILSHHLHRLAGDTLTNLYGALGNALADVFKEASDPLARLVSTEGMPYFTADFRGAVGQLRVWCAVELQQLAADHPLRKSIPDGWRAGPSYQPCALLGPAQNGRPAPFVSVADCVRWTQALRNEQRVEELERERRERADFEEAERREAATERGRLSRLERELAALRAGSSR